MDQPELVSIVKIVESLKTASDWVEEIKNLSLLIDKLHESGKVISVRELAKLIHKTKTWVGVSLVLMKGLKLYPELEKFRNRNQVYKFLQKKQKMRRFIENDN